MNLRRHLALPALLAVVLALGATPALAEDAAVEVQPAAAQDAPATVRPPIAFTKPVFDETWATIGLGAGLVPSYAGSNDYIAFPLPLIVGVLAVTALWLYLLGWALDVLLQGLR